MKQVPIILMLGAMALPAMAAARPPAPQSIKPLSSAPITLADGSPIHVSLSRGPVSRNQLVAVNNSGFTARLSGFSERVVEVADQGGVTIACTSAIPLRGVVAVLDRDTWSAGQYVEAACGDVINLR
jgi:hypothetical protein